MKHLFLLFIFSMCLLTSQAQESPNFKKYKLDNGLTVILDRDNTQTMVYGVVAANAGSQDEKLEATGMAHYLEHMLFKGTTDLGTSDWEKEKPHIDRIYELYDKLQTVDSKEDIEQINKEINKESQEASKYEIPNEFSKLIQQMGGVGLNASTSFDVTQYHNIFPPNQLERWVDLYAHRFEHPVFRLFQTELEAVYEEKNRSEDNPNSAYQDKFLKAAFVNHPYGRPIIGFTEHLKKPWMSKMREFYETWYVPNNMVLILSGNFDMQQAEKLIEQKFGVWKSKEMPERNYPALKPFKGKEVVKVKLTPYLRGQLVYRIPAKSEKDELVMEVVSEILTNSSETGLLDKIAMDGNAMFIGAGTFNLKDGNIFSISFAPVFDINQMRQLSFKSVETLMNKELKKLKSGDYEDWLLSQVKSNMLKDYKLMLESPVQRASILLDLFIRGKEIKSFFEFEKELALITKKEVSEMAKKYISKDYLAFYSYKGEADKEKIKKPKLDPIEPVKHEPSKYAVKFMNIPTTTAEHHFVDFDKDVQKVVFQDKVDLYYVPNKRNDVFSMDIVFHIGTQKLPKLEYSVQLMNNAGIMAQYKSVELHKEFGKIGVTYNFSVGENYTYITMKGNEDKLGEACQLLSRLMLLPKIEDKALDRIIGSEYQNRIIGATIPSIQFNALSEYIKYGDKSSYIDRISFEDLLEVSPTNLTGELNNALSYSADIHFYGKKTIQQVKEILKKNLAFGADRKAGILETRVEKKYDKDLIYLVNNSKSKQSQIFIFVKGTPIPLEKIPYQSSFNQYFGGGFNGLMMKEIREYRSLAYSAGAYVTTPLIPSWNSNLVGVIGTQSDKTVEAVDVVEQLLKDMPEHPEWTNSVQDYLINSSYLIRPADRNLSYSVFRWRLKGYKEDPVKMHLPYYKKMKFDDITSFYENNISNKRIIIGIVGNVSKIDKKSLAKYGKVVKMNYQKLFKK
jgi:predicted Zn-dependent peptidase